MKLQALFALTQISYFDVAFGWRKTYDPYNPVRPDHCKYVRCRGDICPDGSVAPVPKGECCPDRTLCPANLKCKYVTCEAEYCPDGSVAPVPKAEYCPDGSVAPVPK